MATAAKSGCGTAMTYDANMIGEAKYTLPEPVADMLDATTNDSTNCKREFIAGLGDEGEVTIEGNYVPDDAGQAALRTGLGGVAKACVITLPSGAGTLSFNGLVSRFSIQAPHDDILTFSSTVKITGPITYA